MFNTESSFFDTNYFWLIVFVLLGLLLVILKFTVSSGCCPALNNLFGCSIDENGECFSPENQIIPEQMKSQMVGNMNEEMIDLNNGSEFEDKNNQQVPPEQVPPEQQEQEIQTEEINSNNFVENVENNENAENIETINLDNI